MKKTEKANSTSGQLLIVQIPEMLSSCLGIRILSGLNFAEMVLLASLVNSVLPLRQTEKKKNQQTITRKQLRNMAPIGRPRREM